MVIEPYFPGHLKFGCLKNELFCSGGSKANIICIYNEKPVHRWITVDFHGYCLLGKDPLVY